MGNRLSRGGGHNDGSASNSSGRAHNFNIGANDGSRRNGGHDFQAQQHAATHRFTRTHDASRSCLPVDANDKDDVCEISATDFHAARRALDSSTAQVSSGRAFDFNDTNQLNPWAKQELLSKHTPEQGRRSESEIHVRRFADCNDRDLLEYLSSRSVSHIFLTDIDQFMRGHPELASCVEGRRTFMQLNTLPPLEAYKYFLRGYTQPARYVDGVVETANFAIPSSYTYQRLSTKHDPELVDFFDGFDYRHDIIENIDKAVLKGMKDWFCARFVPNSLVKLMCYAMWGNPVDAYKYYEFSYQTEYLPHRYLPEHVILGNVPKPKGYKPRYEATRSRKRHRKVRRSMARANDQGIDVLDVLMTEYRIELVRRGLRRVDIDELVVKAQARLDCERADPTGVDFVDLVMDDVLHHHGPNRNASRAAARRVVRQARQTNSKTFGDMKEHGPLHIYAIQLKQARSDLHHVWTQELQARSVKEYNESTLGQIRASRANAEQQYVDCLIKYLRLTDQMSEAGTTSIQRTFRREKMRGPEVSNSEYLLSMYPQELY